MSKTICISVTNDISYDQRMIKTANSLISMGYDVTIIGRKRKEVYEPIPLIKTIWLELSYSKGKMFYLEYNWKLYQYLKKNKFDIYCAVDLDTIIPNILIAKRTGKKIIYDAHEYFTEVPELIHRPFTKKIWKIIEHWSIPKCDKIYTVGPMIAQLIQNQYKIPCDVLYNVPKKSTNTVDLEVKSPKIVLYQGDLNIGRGLEEMIMAIRNIDAILWIVGGGSLEPVLIELIDSMNLSHKVIMKGKLYPTELESLTKQAYIGLNLLENRSLSYYYSLANKFFDYMQARIPSINMNFPEYQAIVLQYPCALLIDNLAITTIENAIKELLYNEKRYLELQKMCDIASSYFCWENQEKTLRSIYFIND